MIDNVITFRWKDYAHGSKQRLMTLTAEEFLRRFLLHTLPRGFVRIPFFGFLAHRKRGVLLPLCQQLLRVQAELQSLESSFFNYLAFCLVFQDRREYITEVKMRIWSCR